jgi:hypothetical protein
MSTTSYTLAASQANSTVTLATVGPSTLPWTFTIPPNATLDLSVLVGFTSAATTTGISLSLLVQNPVGADATTRGIYRTEIAVDAALTATGVVDGDVISVAANANTSYTVTSAASTAGNMVAVIHSHIRNFATNGNVTVTVQFASEVAASAVTLLAGSTAVGTIS